MTLGIVRGILEPMCVSLAPLPDQTVVTSCQVIVPQTSLWVQLGPYIAFAGALFAFLGGLGELLEAKDKNAGSPLRIGQRTSAWSKMGLGGTTFVVLASMYFAEARVSTDSNDRVMLQNLGILVLATLALMIVIFVALSMKAEKARHNSLQDVPSISTHLPGCGRHFSRWRSFHGQR